jgi:hypothetical protein
MVWRPRGLLATRVPSLFLRPGKPGTSDVRAEARL